MNFSFGHPSFAGVFSAFARGRANCAGLEAYCRQPLPTDSTGNFVLTLAPVVVGSAIQIETQAGAVLANRTATSTSEVFTLAAYPVGSAGNNLRIKVRKGSAAPFYQPYETQTTASVGSQSIFVSQIPD